MTFMREVAIIEREMAAGALEVRQVLLERDTGRKLFDDRSLEYEVHQLARHFGYSIHELVVGGTPPHDDWMGPGSRTLSVVAVRDSREVREFEVSETPDKLMRGVVQSLVQLEIFHQTFDVPNEGQAWMRSSTDYSILQVSEPYPDTVVRVWSLLRAGVPNTATAYYDLNLANLRLTDTSLVAVDGNDGLVLALSTFCPYALLIDQGFQFGGRRAMTVLRAVIFAPSAGGDPVIGDLDLSGVGGRAPVFDDFYSLQAICA